MPRYFVNITTGCLHIEGMCGASKSRPYNCIFFENEEQASGRFTKLCKRCERKRRELEALQELKK